MSLHIETFKLDQRVIFKRSIKWFEGRVVGTPNNNNRESSYQIQEYDAFCEEALYEEYSEPPLNHPGNTYTVARNDIRVFPHEKSIQDRMMESMMKMPTFEDPYAHLYMKKKEHHVIDRQTITMENGDSIKGQTVLIPTAEIQNGMINNQKDLLDMVQTVSNRRKVVEGASDFAVCDISGTLRSIIPEERNLTRLREKAQSDSCAMLQMADIFRFGLMGVPKDRDTALKLYRCAALGVGEHGYDKDSDEWRTNKFVYPMGTSNEALCATALDIWDLLIVPTASSKSFHLIVLEIKYKLENQTMEDWKYNALREIFLFLSHAIRRGWTCPFTLLFGKFMRQLQVLDFFSPESMQLLNVLECKNIQENEAMSFTGNQTMQMPPQMKQYVSRPSEHQLQCFKTHAISIFLGLPARKMNPSGMCASDWHIEFREMAFPPYPILVLAFNPQSSYIHDTVKIPDNLALTPFSTEAFEAIWSQIVFKMHMGDGKGGLRVRPALITFSDKPGDRLFASYVKNAIGANCGTEIKIVDTQSYKVQLFGGSHMAINDLVEDIDTALLEGMRDMMKLNESDIRTPIERDESLFNNRIDMPIDELNSKLEALKMEGNRYFGRGRLQAAKRCYTEAIDLVQSSVSLDDESYKLLGTLLSNRAACFVKMSEVMNPDSAKTALRSAIDDCENALNSACAKFISSSIKAKLEHRKQKAIAGVSRLMSQLSGLSSFYFPGNQGLNQASQEQNLQEEQQPLQQPRRQGQRSNNRGGRKKKKQQQRRRQRQQSYRHQEGDHSEGEEKNEDKDDETTFELTLGKQLLENNITPYVRSVEDTCPCCIERFSVELKDTFAGVNSCGHAYCLPCLSVLRKKSIRGVKAPPFTCPVCRFPIPEDVLTNALNPILSCNQPLQDRLTSLPLLEEESKAVIQNLLYRHDFNISNVLSSLDSMLTDNLQAALRRADNLSPSQKQDIYEQARQPVDTLSNEAYDLRLKMGQARDLESDEYIAMSQRLNKLQASLIPAATKVAVNLIWEKMNSVGTMGAENEAGEIEIDFHALHVRDALERFDEQVLPILPAVGSVLLVVGRGNHSEGGVAKLKPALRRHIEKQSKLYCRPVKDNDGMIRVEWAST